MRIPSGDQIDRLRRLRDGEAMADGDGRLYEEDRQTVAAVLDYVADSLPIDAPILSRSPTGTRDLYWCWHLNEPVIIQYRRGVSHCVNCNADLLGDSESHTFIAHINKPRTVK